MFDSDEISKEFQCLLPEYQILKQVGRGSYGIVVKALKKKTKQIVAIKKFINLFRDIIDTKRILREVAILRKLSEHPHPNIITIYDIVIPNETTVDEIYMITEYCEMDLKTFIYSGFTITPDYIKKITSDCLNGLLYLSKRGIVHRDIKPGNILLNTQPELTAKLCDFGLAREMTLDFSTVDLLNVFLSQLEEGKQCTEEGISLELLKRGIEERNLSVDLQVYVQKKLEELSYEILYHNHSKNKKGSYYSSNQLSSIRTHSFIQDSLENELGIFNYYDLYQMFKKDDMKLRSNLTPHVITRWYRPPELLLMESLYTYTVDIWSLGCVLGEMLLSSMHEKHPMFPGEYTYFQSPKMENGNIIMNYNEQLVIILTALGSVDEKELNFISRNDYKQFAYQVNNYAKTVVPVYKTKFDKCDQKLANLLRGMLKFNPLDRIGIREAIEYLGVTKNIDDKDYEPIVNIWEDNKTIWTFEKLKECFLLEYNEYKVRNLIKDMDVCCNIDEKAICDMTD